MARAGRDTGMVMKGLLGHVAGGRGIRMMRGRGDGLQ